MHARNGEEAIRFHDLLKSEIDVAIIELELPASGGCEVIERFTQRGRKAGEYFDPDWRGQLAQSAREKLDQMQKSVGSRGDAFVDDGNSIPLAVCGAATRLEADLVVIGRGASSGMLGLPETPFRSAF